VYLVNALFGIGQYLAIPEAIVLSTLFTPDAQDLDHVIAAFGGSNIRPWGVMAFPHVYAFSMALWTLFLAAVLACGIGGNRHAGGLLKVALLIGLACTILSAQRSAVWIVCAGLMILWLAATRVNAVGRTLVVLVLVIGSVSLIASFSERDDSLKRLSQVEDASQTEREGTWVSAVRMIQEDPLFGSAYRVLSGHRGIHNGFLAGWARYGILWLILFCGALLLLLRLIVRSTVVTTAKISATLLIAEIIGHALAHTNFITLGDLVAWSYLGFAIVLVQRDARTAPSHAPPNGLQPSGATP
jgi:O-antigen ligase